MNIARIPKRNGKFRVVYCPNDAEYEASSKWIPKIVAAIARAPAAYVQHGFTAARSSVTNALHHKNWRYTLNFDLENWFDTVTPEHVRHTIPVDVNILDCFYDGAARQGLPSSPAIANLAAAPLDADIVALNRTSRLGPMFVYTRYADDLTFSFNYSGTEAMLRAEIPKLVVKHGFKINEAKTHLQHARQGRRHITGVAVDDHGPHLPRSTKRKLRAIEHQMKSGLRGRGLRFHIARQREHKWRGDDISLAALLHGQHRGLLEWAKLRLPEGYNNRPRPAAPALNQQGGAATTTATTMPYPTGIGQRQFALP